MQPVPSGHCGAGHPALHPPRQVIPLPGCPRPPSRSSALGWPLADLSLPPTRLTMRGPRPHCAEVSPW